MRTPLFIASSAALIAFLSGCTNQAGVDATNAPPRIVAFAATPEVITLGESSAISCEAADDDGDNLQYRWTSEAGNISGSGKTVYFSGDACCGGAITVTVTVVDGRGGEVSQSVIVEVQ